MNHKAGRLRGGGSDTLYDLIHHGCVQGEELALERVTTGVVEDVPSVSAGMIRYYFVDKAGLFEAMLRETMAPLLALAQQQARTVELRDPGALVAAYYAVMMPHPQLPTLIFRALHNSQSVEFQIVTRVFSGFVQQMLSSMQQVLSTPELLREGVQPLNALLTCLSLSIFPFVMPPFIKQALGIELSPEFLQQLAFHQRDVILHGLIKLNQRDGDPHA